MECMCVCVCADVHVCVHVHVHVGMYGHEPTHVYLRSQHLMSCSTALYLILFLNYIYLCVPQHHNRVCRSEDNLGKSLSPSIMWVLWMEFRSSRTLGHPTCLPLLLFEVGILTQLVTHQFGQAGWPTVSKSLDTGIRLCHHSWFYVNTGDPNKSKRV